MFWFLGSWIAGVICAGFLMQVNQFKFLKPRLPLLIRKEERKEAARPDELIDARRNIAVEEIVAKMQEVFGLEVECSEIDVPGLLRADAECEGNAVFAKGVLRVWFENPICVEKMIKVAEAKKLKYKVLSSM